MKAKDKRKGKEKETCSRASTNNLALILTRIISFNLSREHQLLTYSLDFSVTKLGSMGLVSFIPCRRRERRLDDTDATLVISDATNLKIAAKGFLAKYSFIDQ